MIVALSTKLDKMKDTNIKLEKLFKSKGTPKGNTNKKVNQKGNNNHPPKENNINKYAWNKVPPKQCEKYTKKQRITKLTTGVSGISHG